MDSESSLVGLIYLEDWYGIYPFSCKIIWHLYCSLPSSPCSLFSVCSDLLAFHCKHTVNNMVLIILSFLFIFLSFSHFCLVNILKSILLIFVWSQYIEFTNKFTQVMARSAWQSTFRFCLLVWRLSLFYLFACLHSMTGAVSVHGIDAHYKRIHITSTKKASNLETSRNCVFAFAFFLVAVPCFARPPSCFLRF